MELSGSGAVVDKRGNITLISNPVEAGTGVGSDARNSNYYYIDPLYEKDSLLSLKSPDRTDPRFFQDEHPEGLEEIHDPLWESQWGLIRVGVEVAWERVRGKGVVVAIIDTGCDMDHPDLAGRVWENEKEKNGLPGVDDDANGYIDDIKGWDFVSVSASLAAEGEDPGPPDNNPDDFDGHGTHIAGIISGSSGNGIGIEGAAPLSKVMILRAAYRSIYGYSVLKKEDIIEAVLYAKAMGADVINMSFGGEDTTLRSVIDMVVAEGITVVAAAGNYGGETPQYPAAFETVIGVTASDREDRVAIFGERGSWVDCAAPGTAIISCDPDGYRWRNGTSCAAALVSGCVALVRSAHPLWQPNLVKAQVVNTAMKTEMADTFAETPPICMAGQAVVQEPRIKISLIHGELLEIEGNDDNTIDKGEVFRGRFIVKNEWKKLEESAMRIESPDVGIVVECGDIYIDQLTTGAEKEIEFLLRADSGGISAGEIDLSLKVFTEGEQRSYPFILRKSIPEIKIGKVALEEVTGNGNGGVDPGERIRLGVEIINGGENTRDALAVIDSGIFGGGNIECNIYGIAPAGSGWAEFLLDIDEEAEKGGFIDLPLEVRGDGFSMKKTIALWIAYSGDGNVEDTAILQNDACHSGIYGKLSENIGLLVWKRRLEGEGTPGVQPVIRNGKLYISRREPEGVRLWAINIENGDVLWKTLLRGIPKGDAGGICWAGGVCYVSSGSIIHAVDVKTGRVVWMWPGAGVAEDIRVVDPAFSGQRVITGFYQPAREDSGFVYALNPFTGRTIWKRENRFLSAGAPACNGESIFITGWDNTLKAINLESGEVEWRSGSKGIASVWPVVGPGRVSIPLTNGCVATLDTESGEEISSSLLEGIPVGASLLSGKEKLAVMTRIAGGSTINMINTTTGETLSKTEISEFYGEAIITSGSRFLAVGSGGEYIFVDSEGESQSTRISKFADGDFERASCSVPAVSDGVLYLAFNSNDSDFIAAFGLPADNRFATRINNCFPNPFNPDTRVTFEIGRKGRVKIAIYDVKGRLVKILMDEEMFPGTYAASWNGRTRDGAPVSSGVYFCRLKTPDISQTKKLVLLR
ncbi:S8 family serine peptidase [bacterium]|nr:S8 family serine peptidase [bacterium]